MQVKDYFLRESVPQRIANANGKFSTQFMGRGSRNEKTSEKNNPEENNRTGGYEMNVRKPAINRTDMQQPMAGYSEFWIG